MAAPFSDSRNTDGSLRSFNGCGHYRAISSTSSANMNLSSHCQSPSRQKLLPETTSSGIPSFPWKLHGVLGDAERTGFTNIISWTLNGRAFRVHDQKEFESKIMRQYFNQTQYKSFQRQLNLYNFIRITAGNAKGSYMHDFMIRGKPDMCRFMVRTKNKRRSTKGMRNSSEKLSEWAKQQTQMTAASRHHKQSLDNRNSPIMARGSSFPASRNTNGGLHASDPTGGLPNQVFRTLQRLQQLKNPLPRQELAQQQQQTIVLQNDVCRNSNQLAPTLQRSFIPNQVLPLDIPCRSSLNPNIVSRQQRVQPPEAVSRRLSLKMFQDLSKELSRKHRVKERGRHILPLDAPLVSSSNDDFIASTLGNNDDCDDDDDDDDDLMCNINGGMLDQLFDDDLESIGEPVALEQASTVFRGNKGIPLAMADLLLHSMFQSSNSSNLNIRHHLNG